MGCEYWFQPKRDGFWSQQSSYEPCLQWRLKSHCLFCGAKLIAGKIVSSGLDDSVRFNDAGFTSYSSNKVGTDGPVCDCDADGSAAVAASMKTVYLFNNGTLSKSAGVSYQPMSVAVNGLKEALFSVSLLQAPRLLLVGMITTFMCTTQTSPKKGSWKVREVLLRHLLSLLMERLLPIL